MKILNDDHKITGEEFVRQIRPVPGMSDSCALSCLLLFWHPIKRIFGSYWKGKKIGRANKYLMYEFAEIEEGEYFPNVASKNPAGVISVESTWKK